MSDAKSDWIYCQLVDSRDAMWPNRRMWMGQAELNKEPESNAIATTALQESMSEFAVMPTADEMARGRFARARLFIPDVDVRGALRFGEHHLRESLRVLKQHEGMGFDRISPTGAGYLFNLRAFAAYPLRRPRQERSFLGTVFTLDERAVHPRHTLNTLLVAPQAFGELGRAFCRSAHWREVAQSADDVGQRLVLYWMASECLCKTHEDDDAGAKLLAVAGFPSTRLAKALPSATSLALRRDPRYAGWRTILLRVIEQLRIARNQVVHAGYRHVDLPLVMPVERDVALAQKVFPLLVRMLADFALRGLQYRHTTVEQLWTGYGALVADDLPRNNSWFIDRLEDSSDVEAEPALR